MKSLFISSNLLNNKNGGWQCSNRNFESIKELSSIIHTYNILPNNKLSYFDMLLGFYNLLKLYSGGVNSKHISNILAKIKSEKYDLVFLDSSVYGKLARQIKKRAPNVKLVAFYHNVEYDFIKKIIRTGGLFHILRLPSCFFNEFLTAKWCDKIISLTNEDKQLINQYYTDKKEIIQIPISFKRIERNLKGNKQINHSNEIQVLFVGSYFYANNQGITWFIDQINFSSEIKIIVVGKEMEKLRPLIDNSKNVEIHDSVDDLSVFYERANIVVCPLFYGGGMKVKVAEALMYGKKIIGTELAFFGYEPEKCPTMITTSDAEVYKKVIENLNSDITTYDESILHFEKYFSYSSTLKLFHKALVEE